MWLTIKREKNKRNILIYAVVALLFGVAAFLCGTHWAASLGGAALLFCILFFSFRLSDELPSWASFLILAVFTFIVFVFMQTTISCGIFLIGPLKIVLNLLLMLGVASLFWIITGSIRISTLILLAFCYLIAIIDHVVVQARSFEIQFSDIYSIGVAAKVAGGYSFTLSTVTKIGILLGTCLIVFLIRTYMPRQKRSRSMMLFALGSVVVTILCGVIIYTQVAASVIGYQDKYWKYRGSERNGFWVNMIYSASATRVMTPSGYDPDTLEQQLEAYLSEEDEANADVQNTEKHTPNVIVVMNETFSDVQNIARYLGKEIPASQPITPFLDSLSNESSNVIKGHSLVSVYGGNTANSELEFLSGLSIQFIPRNTVAYNLYMTENNSFTLVDLFNQAGYHTLGIHPEDRTNWQREKIYGYFGFEETCFADEFTGLTDADYYRDHISDAAVYNKVIEKYETREDDAPLFAFVVTMQNHGGYTTSGFDYTVTMEGYENYTGVQEYLSSIHNADAAFQELVEYFAEQDEETVILFFGDHQPSLTNIGKLFFNVTDDSDTAELQAKYVVPYVFWANYDLELDKATELTSLNFLSTYLLDLLDMEGTPFLQFVNKIHENVMAINAFGWYDYDGVFHESSYSAANLTDPLWLYSYLQYNVLYDNTNKLSHLFQLGK